MQPAAVRTGGDGRPPSSARSRCHLGPRAVRSGLRRRSTRAPGAGCGLRLGSSIGSQRCVTPCLGLLELIRDFPLTAPQHQERSSTYWSSWSRAPECASACGMCPKNSSSDKGWIGQSDRIQTVYTASDIARANRLPTRERVTSRSTFCLLPEIKSSRSASTIVSFPAQQA